jgi:hypothetical protein
MFAPSSFVGFSNALELTVAQISTTVAPMSFLISASDTCGRVRLRRETADAAVKKAAELAADGYRDIAITGPDGHIYAPWASDELPANGRTTQFN